MAPNGLVCLTYVDNSVAYYQISDSSTGQQIVNRTTLPSTATNPRTFILGPWFIITYIATVSGTPTLQFIAIPTAAPRQPKAPITISGNVNGLTAGYDAYVANDNLFIAWGESGAAVGFAYVTVSLIPSGTVSIAGTTAALISVTVDVANHVVWISYWDSASMNASVVAYNYIQGQLVTPTQIIAATAIAEITSVAQNGILTVFYETINNYPYTDDTGSLIRTDFVSSVTVTMPVGVGAGIVGPTTIILRSVGLASKAFTKRQRDYLYIGSLWRCKPAKPIRRFSATILFLN